MKIQDGAVSTELERASGLQPAGSLQSSQGARVRETGEDRLEISSFADRVSSTTALHLSQRADRVKQLTALYESGRYEVDTSKVSRAIVYSAFAPGWPVEQ